MTEEVKQAAHWYATIPAIDRAMRPAVPLLKEKFGLTAKQAVDALREATLIRARAA